MTYYDKYHCINCPVEKYCGTAVSCFRLCHSYNDDVSEKESSHVLALSKATSDAAEEEYVEEKLTMWDNVTD